MNMRWQNVWVGILFWVSMAGIVPGLEARDSRVDLALDSIQIQPARPTDETPLVFVAAIRNNGSEPVAGVYASLTLFGRGKVLKAIEDIPVLPRLPRLGTGFSVPISVGKFEAGDYEIHMRVAAKSAPESVKDNNQLKKSFHVWPSGRERQTYEGYSV